MMLLVVTIPVGFFSVLTWAALWGYIGSWLNEFIKQDHWPKALNTIVADVVMLVGAAFAALLASPDQTLTWDLFVTALLGAFAAAVANHTLFLKPTGVGPAIQTATTFRRRPAPHQPPQHRRAA